MVVKKRTIKVYHGVEIPTQLSVGMNVATYFEALLLILKYRGELGVHLYEIALNFDISIITI